MFLISVAPPTKDLSSLHQYELARRSQEVVTLRPSLLLTQMLGFFIGRLIRLKAILARPRREKKVTAALGD